MCHHGIWVLSSSEQRVVMRNRRVISLMRRNALGRRSRSSSANSTAWRHPTLEMSRSLIAASFQVDVTWAYSACSWGWVSETARRGAEWMVMGAMSGGRSGSEYVRQSQGMVMFSCTKLRMMSRISRGRERRVGGCAEGVMVVSFGCS